MVRFWPIAVTRLRSTRPSCPLIGWSLWDPGDLKGGDARHSVIKPLLHTTAVHHILDAGDRQRRLGHVSRDDTQTRSSGRRTENLNTHNTSKRAEHYNNCHKCFHFYMSEGWGQSKIKIVHLVHLAAFYYYSSIDIYSLSSILIMFIYLSL